jgi:hypothetical protein
MYKAESNMTAMTGEQIFNRGNAVRADINKFCLPAFVAICGKNYEKVTSGTAWWRPYPEDCMMLRVKNLVYIADAAHQASEKIKRDRYNAKVKARQGADNADDENQANAAVGNEDAAAEDEDEDELEDEEEEVAEEEPQAEEEEEDDDKQEDEAQGDEQAEQDEDGDEEENGADTAVNEAESGSANAADAQGLGEHLAPLCPANYHPEFWPAFVLLSLPAPKVFPNAGLVPVDQFSGSFASQSQHQAAGDGEPAPIQPASRRKIKQRRAAFSRLVHEASEHASEHGSVRSQSGSPFASLSSGRGGGADDERDYEAREARIRDAEHLYALELEQQRRETILWQAQMRNSAGPRERAAEQLALAKEELHFLTKEEPEYEQVRQKILRLLREISAMPPDPIPAPPPMRSSAAPALSFASAPSASAAVASAPSASAVLLHASGFPRPHAGMFCYFAC